MPGARPPSVEPEIIPPGANWQRGSRIWASADQHHTTRIWITPLGPLGFVFFVLLAVILAFAGIAFLFGAALVGIAARRARVVLIRKLRLAGTCSSTNIRLARPKA